MLALVCLTMLAFLIKACAVALKKFPEFNSSLDGDNLVFKQYYHVAFAADTPNGLVAPVIKNADQKSVSELAVESGELARKARDGKLSPAEMSGACFTISSVGGIGGTHFSPIVNAPEVAILGVSKSVMKPVWNGKEFAPRLILPRRQPLPPRRRRQALHRLRRPRRRSLAAPTSNAGCWLSALVPAATRPRFAAPTSACRPCSSNATRRSAAFA